MFGPEIFERNANKLFPSEGPPSKKKKPKRETSLTENRTNIAEIVNNYREQQSSSTDPNESKVKNKRLSANEVLLEAELKQVKGDLDKI